MANAVTLYHTDGCHLCEQAEGLLKQAHINFLLVDIISDPDLVARYGVRIPVIRLDNNAELGWPFDLAQLKQFTGE
ncbi:glutaredoxin family protein [uncultured Ferrimonas sp.]|uniref:glutaredoxin family protein n=1 Tax=uncultured Ferrimonas sp. TaxID=432640 RepID=UPI0026212EE6|nr:glutaredoxin family protein [uncultured Ferrimonas sp.]